MDIGSNLRLIDGAQLLDVVIHKAASDPAGWEAGIYFNTVSKMYRWHNGTKWIDFADLTGVIVAVNGGVGIVVTTPSAGTAKVAIVVDNATIETASGVDGAAIRVKDGGISAAKLATDSVETAKIKNLNVTAGKLATDSVETGKIKNLNVTTAKLADGAVTTAKLADDAVETAKIKNLNVTTPKLADSAVTDAKLATDSVTTNKIKDGNVTTDKLANSAVTAVKLATDSVETAKIKDGNVTTAKLADNAVTTAKIANSNVTTAKIADNAVTVGKIEKLDTLKVLGRVTAGNGNVEKVSILTNITSASAHDTLATAFAVKSYIDTVVGGIGKPKGGFDAANATNFPSGSKEGDYWYASSAGTVRTVAFDIGDMLIAKKDSASTTSAADWLILETNRDAATTTAHGWVKLATTALARGMSDTATVLTPSNLGDIKASEAQTQAVYASAVDNYFVTPKGLASRTASTIRQGIVALATQGEVNTGSDNTKAVTSSTLNGKLGSYVRKFAADIGNGSSTNISVTHSLGTEDVEVSIYKKGTPKSKVICDVDITGVNTVSIGFATAPASNAYRVVITG